MTELKSNKKAKHLKMYQNIQKREWRSQNETAWLSACVFKLRKMYAIFMKKRITSLLLIDYFY